MTDDAPELFNMLYVEDELTIAKTVARPLNPCGSEWI
jgi:hypothetical protein